MQLENEIEIFEDPQRCTIVVIDTDRVTPRRDVARSVFCSRSVTRNTHTKRSPTETLGTQKVVTWSYDLLSFSRPYTTLVHTIGISSSNSVHVGRPPGFGGLSLYSVQYSAVHTRYLPTLCAACISLGGTVRSTKKALGSRPHTRFLYFGRAPSVSHSPVHLHALPLRLLPASP